MHSFHTASQIFAFKIDLWFVFVEFKFCQKIWYEKGSRVNHASYLTVKWIYRENDNHKCGFDAIAKSAIGKVALQDEQTQRNVW